MKSDFAEYYQVWLKLPEFRNTNHLTEARLDWT